MQEYFSNFVTLSFINQKVFIRQGWLIPFWIANLVGFNIRYENCSLHHRR